MMDGRESQNGKILPRNVRLERKVAFAVFAGSKKFPESNSQKKRLWRPP